MDPFAILRFQVLKNSSAHIKKEEATMRRKRSFYTRILLKKKSRNNTNFLLKVWLLILRKFVRKLRLLEIPLEVINLLVLNRPKLIKISG